MFACCCSGANYALASENKDSYRKFGVPAKRHCMGVCAVENSMLFILDIIISLTQITGRGGPGVPCCGLKAKGVDVHWLAKEDIENQTQTHNHTHTTNMAHSPPPKFWYLPNHCDALQAHMHFFWKMPKLKRTTMRTTRPS